MKTPGRRHWRQTLMTVGVISTSVVATAVATAPSASADALYCGPSENVTSVQVQDYAEGHFKVILSPTDGSRFALDSRAATVTAWHAVQRCVPGLYGELADSMWAQLECHQQFALTPGKDGWATGPTYDLESWHGLFSQQDYFPTRCGNELGVQPAGPLDEPHDPSTGWTDLPSWGNVA